MNKYNKREKLDFSLRLALIDNCNYKCQYCPRETSMENYCPHELKQDIPNIEVFKGYLKKVLDKYSFSKVVITGGEPLLSEALSDVLKYVKSYDEMIELDTNGSLFNSVIWCDIRRYVDAVKVSLDTLNQEKYDFLTNNFKRDALDNVLKLCDACVKDNIPLTLNTVYTKTNKDDVLDIIKYATEKSINVSLLDLYYTKETEKFWKDNFISVKECIDKLSDNYNVVEQDDFFGCKFYEIYYSNKNYIRFKLSEQKTMRDALCNTCDSYCQEGIFALRISHQGWVTSCQLNEGNGVWLGNSDVLIDTVVHRIQNAKIDIKSFEKMCDKHGLE